MRSNSDLALFILMLVGGAFLVGIGGFLNLNAHTGAILTDPTLYRISTIFFLVGIALCIIAIFLIYKLGQSQ
jgi:uncharacterized protein HemY